MEEILEQKLLIQLLKVELLQHFLQLRKLLRATRKAFVGHMLPAGSMLCRSGLWYIYFCM